jgi:hypothetical protein
VADIFVSFTKSDRRWAHWVAQELTALHHEPHVHDWEIVPRARVTLTISSFTAPPWLTPASHARSSAKGLHAHPIASAASQ